VVACGQARGLPLHRVSPEVPPQYRTDRWFLAPRHNPEKPHLRALKSVKEVYILTQNDLKHQFELRSKDW
jgi:hypothetical protein